MHRRFTAARELVTQIAEHRNSREIKKGSKVVAPNND